MSNAYQVGELENRLGVSLPSGYRSFLLSHSQRDLHDALVFKTPRSGVIDYLLTSAAILQNDEENCIGIPKDHLLYIGGNLLGGYLYLSLAPKTFGHILYSENCVMKERFPSFEKFLNETEKEELA